MSEPQESAALGRLAPLATTQGGDKPVRLGLLGGTFDPPHHGHLLLAQSAYEQFGLDGVLLIPTGLPFYKSARQVTDPSQRLAMLELAIGDDGRFAASRVEIDRAGPSYTIDTLELVGRALSGAAELFWIVGADALADMPRWKDAARIAQLATVLYADRPGLGPGGLAEVVGKSPFTLRRIEQPPLALSSTTLRARAAASLSLRYYTPGPVAAYIAADGLYREGPGC